MTALSSVALPSSGAGVGGVVDLGEVLKVKMGIDLRRGDVGMTEQFLDAAQIGARLQQMAGKRMTEHVRMDVDSQSGASRPNIDPQLHGARREAPAAAANE